MHYSYHIERPIFLTSRKTCESLVEMNVKVGVKDKLGYRVSAPVYLWRYTTIKVFKLT